MQRFHVLLDASCNLRVQNVCKVFPLASPISSLPKAPELINWHDKGCIGYSISYARLSGCWCADVVPSSHCGHDSRDILDIFDS